MHAVHFAQEIFVVGDLRQPCLLAELQHAQRAVIRAVPQIVIQVAEELPRVGLPRPPEVVNHLGERLERFRKLRRDVISMNWLHEVPCWIFP